LKGKSINHQSSFPKKEKDVISRPSVSSLKKEEILPLFLYPPALKKKKRRTGLFSPY
jgi:hypothetical protein